MSYDMKKLCTAGTNLMGLLHRAKRQEKQIVVLFASSEEFSVKATFKRVKNGRADAQYRREIGNRIWIDDVAPASKEMIEKSIKARKDFSEGSH